MRNSSYEMHVPPLPRLSVIIPLAPGELDWQGLAGDLRDLPPAAEIIFVGPQAPTMTSDCRELWMDGAVVRIAWVRSALGRAHQLNAGARAASGDFLWFLHADSRLPRDWRRTLARSLARAPTALHYFDLAFAAGSPRLMRLNALGVYIRARVCGLPFGDQGFCINKKIFKELAGFDESAAYGEDHLLVWRVKKRGLPLQPVGAVLTTSARRYRDYGWLRTTCRHLALTWRQAAPEWRALRRQTKQMGRHGPTLQVAVFVKTPGLSPVKTRLAADMGDAAALAFFKLAAAAVAAVLRAAGGAEAWLKPYWAVAEAEGAPSWPGFAVVAQGEGGLGTRLAHVYGHLLQPEGAVVLIGADAPQIDAELFERTRVLLIDHDFVVGPALDGGFYLMAGRKEVAAAAWANISYSQPHTCDELLAELRQIGRVALLPALGDVDVAADLPHLISRLSSHPGLLPEQQQLLTWLRLWDKKALMAAEPP